MDVSTQDGQARRRLEFEEDNDATDFCINDESENSLHVKISKEMIPRIGMEFETEEATYQFYNAYAMEVGFSVRRSKSHKLKGILVDRTFVCSCEGKRGRDKRDDAYKSHRPETRFGCLAMLKINCRYTFKFTVEKFVAEHNHLLASPSKAHLFRSHRKVSISQAMEVEMADGSGIAPRNAYELMAKQAGGRESLGFVRMDYNNHLRGKRNLQVRPGETGGVLEYLKMMRLKDPNFFYAIQVDEDDLITNIFWADGRMVSDYDDFGDVVCFDTTYRKHKDGRPIALFVGVNHHKQSIIFGVALLYDETSDTFMWLFDTFAKAMGEKLPKTMLTDQDAAMSKALSCQWPKTYHRLCVWHIFQNAATHLSSVFGSYKEFATDFSNCVYDHDYEEDFLDAWDKMLHKYGLQSNDWLKRLFNVKEKWALVYGRDTFCADMISTQRSESMNKVIKHYVSYKHELRRFFEHFQRLLDDRRYDEMVADFKTNHRKVALVFEVEILKHAASVYTPEVFSLFQAELGRAYDCQIETLSSSDEVVDSVRFKVKPAMKNYSYLVSYNSTEDIMSCSCRKFEFAGILCCHILKILSLKGILKVPQNYILKRWTKDAKKKSSVIINESSVDEDPKAAMGRRYREVCRYLTRLATRSGESEEVYTIVIDVLVNLLKQVDLNATGKSMQSTPGSHVLGNDPNPSEDVSMCQNDKLKTIRGIKLKPKSGNRSSKRISSALEKATRRKRAKKKQLSIVGEQNDLDNHVEHAMLDPHLECPTQNSSLVHVLQHEESQSTWQTSAENNQLGSNNFTQDLSFVKLLDALQEGNAVELNDLWD